MTDDVDASEFWNAHYAGPEQVWSGRPNAVLVAEAAALTPGTALDVGCGEGGDAVWLAEQGWHVEGVDIAAGAIERARQLAAQRAVPAERLSWHVTDLATWRPERTYDLVSSCFLHSPVEFPRTDVLRRAASAVAPGGHLLIVGHAAPPPWAWKHSDHAGNGHEHVLLSAREQLDELDLAEADWQVVCCEDRSRPAVGPDGEQADIDDAVLLARRR